MLPDLDIPFDVTPLVWCCCRNCRRLSLTPACPHPPDHGRRGRARAGGGSLALLCRLPRPAPAGRRVAGAGAGATEGQAREAASMTESAVDAGCSRCGDCRRVIRLRPVASDGSFGGQNRGDTPAGTIPPLAFLSCSKKDRPHCGMEIRKVLGGKWLRSGRA